MKLLLIDGHYYVYRSFFALPPLNNSRGEPTNAILGFTKTVRRMLKDLQPEMGAVFWDEGLPQKRVELQPALRFPFAQRLSVDRSVHLARHAHIPSLRHR